MIDYLISITSKFVLIFALVCLSTLPCSAELSEVQTESAYVFNFIKFVEWPANTFKVGDKIKLCVIGNDSLLTSLSTLDGHKVGAYELQVILRSNNNDNYNNCHVLYIDEIEERHLTPILKSVGEKAILTISDIPNFAERGGNIGLLYRKNQVMFEINLASTRKARLRLSSQMLNLATNIFGK